jgi:hypothetical protein
MCRAPLREHGSGHERHGLAPMIYETAARRVVAVKDLRVAIDIDRILRLSRDLFDDFRRVAKTRELPSKLSVRDSSALCHRPLRPFAMVGARGSPCQQTLGAPPSSGVGRELRPDYVAPDCSLAWNGGIWFDGDHGDDRIHGGPGGG